MKCAQFAHLQLGSNKEAAAIAAACGSRLEVKADYFRSGDHRAETDGDLEACGVEVPSGPVLMLQRDTV